MIRQHLFSLTVSLCLGFTAAAHAVCPSVPTASRFSVNAAGDEVTDARTGLVWARCSVGQVWDGTTCSGIASSYTHEQALSFAQGAVGWRLPSVRELSSLADKGCQSPAIDSAAFPNTRDTAYWSSTPYVGGAVGNSWGVVFDRGSVANNVARHDAVSVRLLRVDAASNGR